MTSETQTRFPRVLRRVEHAHAPSQMRYVGIAIFLAIITSLEVLIYYPSIDLAFKATILVFLAAIKFFTVAAFFMHLRFDGRLLSFIFISGLALAFIAFTIAITSARAVP